MNNTIYPDEIEITVDDFRKATKYIDRHNCPLATALKRITQNEFIQVGGNGFVDSEKEFAKVRYEWDTNEKKIQHLKPIDFLSPDFFGVDDLIKLAKNGLEFKPIKVKRIY